MTASVASAVTVVPVFFRPAARPRPPRPWSPRESCSVVCYSSWEGLNEEIPLKEILTGISAKEDLLLLSVDLACLRKQNETEAGVASVNSQRGHPVKARLCALVSPLPRSHSSSSGDDRPRSSCSPPVV